MLLSRVYRNKQNISPKLHWNTQATSLFLLTKAQQTGRPLIVVMHGLYLAKCDIESWVTYCAISPWIPSCLREVGPQKTGPTDPHHLHNLSLSPHCCPQLATQAPLLLQLLLLHLTCDPGLLYHPQIRWTSTSPWGAWLCWLLSGHPKEFWHRLFGLSNIMGWYKW